MLQEGKYKLAVINRETLEPIPEVEPFFILRAKDNLAIKTLQYYRTLAEEAGCPVGHIEAITKRVAEFLDFSVQYYKHMKAPD